MELFTRGNGKTISRVVKDARSGQMGLNTGDNLRMERNGVMGLYSLQMVANIQESSFRARSMVRAHIGGLMEGSIRENGSRTR
jgi:hypothetical protein